MKTHLLSSLAAILLSATNVVAQNNTVPQTTNIQALPAKLKLPVNIRQIWTDGGGLPYLVDRTSAVGLATKPQLDERPRQLASILQFATADQDVVRWDGSDWRKFTGSLPSTGQTGLYNAGPTGTFYARIFDGPVLAQYFGATGNGAANETALIDAALASPFPVVRLQRGVFMADEISVPTGKTLIIDVSATLRQRAISNSTTKALLHLATASKLGGGGTIDGNGPALKASRTNNSALNYGISVDGDSVQIDGITTRNTITVSLFALNRKAVRISNYTEIGVGRGGQFLYCQDVTVTNFVTREADMSYAQVYQHLLDFQNCRNVKLNGARFLNPNSSAAAPSSAISGLTLLGCSDSSYENLVFNGFLSTVNVGLPIADDGSTNSLISNVVMSGWKYEVGLEVQGGTHCTYQNFLIDGTILNNTVSGPVGVHVLDTGIMGGMLSPLTGEIQSRDRTNASNCKFVNFNVIGGYAGYRVAGGHNLFQNCTTTGNTYGWRIQQKQGGPLTNYWRTPIEQRINDNLFVDCQALQSGIGFLFWGGQDNRLVRPVALNCGTGFANWLNVTSAVASATSTTATLATSTTANAYKNQMLFITNGTGTGQIRKILSHTATVYTLDAAWTTTPDATSEAVVVDNPQGTIYLDSPIALDNQAFTLMGAATFPLTNTNPAALTQITVATGGERINFNQKLKLKNVITGAGNADLIVQVTGIDKGSRDRLIITPLTLGDGSAIAGTLAPTLTTGTGTLTTSNWTAYTTQLGQVDGSGTDLAGEIDAHYWIKVGGEWRQVLKANSDTQYTLTQAVTTPGSGLPFQICKVDIEGIPSMTNGVAFNRYYGDVVVSGEMRIEGSSSTPFNAFRSRSAGAIELTPNSVTPSVARGTLFKTNNTSATAYTNFGNASLGKRITILVTDANTTFAYVVGSLKGYSQNYAASVGDVLTATYDGTNWLTQIIPVGGRFQKWEFGSASATSNVLAILGGGAGADFIQLIRTLGLTSTMGLGVTLGGFTVRDVTGNKFVLTAGVSGSNVRIVAGADQAAAVTGSGEFSAPSVTGGITDSPGAGVIVASGRGTGNSPLQPIYFYTADAGSSGTTMQSRSEKGRISGLGNLMMGTTTDNARDKIQVAGSILFRVASGAAAPTTTNLPNDKDSILWKNTTDGSIKWYSNDNGTIKAGAAFN